MITMQLKEIGILLIQIDIEQWQLARLFMTNKLRSAKAYQRECRRLEKIRNRVLRELDEIVKQRYWRSPKIK